MRYLLLFLTLMLFLQSDLMARGYVPFDRMPLVPDESPGRGFGDPVPKTDKNVWFYLQASVRILNGSVCGSGTICHYQVSTNTAYVISCGHLFNGNKIPSGRPESCKIEVFYKNYSKLPKAESFNANVVCHSSSEDISFLTFNPNWRPATFFPIAPRDYQIKSGDWFESTGCDGADETAAYSVMLDGSDQSNLRTVSNSPRPGRSGGGLLSSDGYYLGVVWGTSDYSGNGYGYYVPLKRIHAYANQFPETAWLLRLAGTQNLINSIPVVDLEGKVLKKPLRYFPIP